MYGNKIKNGFFDSMVTDRVRKTFNPHIILQINNLINDNIRIRKSGQRVHF